VILEALRGRDLDFHQIYASTNNDQYCVKLALTSSLLEELAILPSATLLLPYPKILKLDLTVHYIFHYLFQQHAETQRLTRDPLVPSFHPFVSHFLSLRKIGLHVLLHQSLQRDEKRSFAAALQRKLNTPLSLTEFRESYLSFFQISEARRPQRNMENFISDLQASPSRLFPVSHYLHFLNTVDSGDLEACRWVSADDWNVRYHKYGILVMIPGAIFQQIRGSQSVDRRKGMTCLLRMLLVLSTEPGVQKVAFSSPVRVLNNLGREIIQSGTIGGAGEVYGKAGLTGTGVVLGVSDTGIDENNCYFQDAVLGKVPRSSEIHPHTDNRFRKVIQYVNFSGSAGDYPGGHGSHVAGTLAGYCVNCNSGANSYMGMANQAKLAFFDIGMDDSSMDLVLPEDMKYVFEPAFQGGAHIHSNSWGGDIFYDSLALETDEYLYNNPKFLTFFAAGNSGSAGKETVLSPGTAKNSIAVACTETGHSGGQNIGYIASFSSNGPSIDGRLKPDIAGPGYSIYSAKARSEHSSSPSCDTEPKAGTSMATPVVAGNAGLIVQYFQDPKFWKKYCNPVYSLCKAFTISGPLLKALVLHSGKAVLAYRGSKLIPLSNPPDTYQGYGRMDLMNILPLASYQTSNLQLFVEDNTLHQLTERRYFISFSGQSSLPFKVTLSWYDPPNREFVAQVVLNDLDLVLTDPNGNQFYGNINSQDGVPLMGAHPDELNNNEQITIANPIVGKWTISVQAKALMNYLGAGKNSSALSQRFALVVTSVKGTVVDATHNELRPLPLSSLMQCPAWDSFLHPKLELRVALWSRVSNRGWNGADYFEILQDQSQQLVPVHRAHFTTPFPFAADTICLAPGSYVAQLVVNSSQSMRGSQASVPQCNQLLLTPFAPRQSFTVLNTTLQKDENFDGAEYRLFPSNEKNCLSSCHLRDHGVLKTVLVEYGGEGWSGAYYTVMSDLPPDSPPKERYAVSDALQWDFVQSHDVCVPYEAQCYLVQLSFPAGTRDEPEIYFEKATDLSTGGDCPFRLNMSFPLAKFCVPSDKENSSTVSLRFYAQKNSIADLGLRKTNVNYRQYYETFVADSQLRYLGECGLSLDYVLVNPLFPARNITDDDQPGGTNGTIDIPVDDYLPSESPASSIPSSHPSQLPPFFSPSFSPTLLPSRSLTRPPTEMPSAPPSDPTQPDNDDTSEEDLADPKHFDLSCLADCPRFPGQIDPTTINRHYSNLTDSNPVLDKLCEFLASLFYLCDSYSIASGLCYERAALNGTSSFHRCLRDCSTETFCYFGAGLVTSCPDQLQWRSGTNESREIRAECVQSLASQTAADDSSSSSSRMNARLTLAFLVGKPLPLPLSLCLAPSYPTPLSPPLFSVSRSGQRDDRLLRRRLRRAVHLEGLRALRCPLPGRSRARRPAGAVRPKCAAPASSQRARRLGPALLRRLPLSGAPVAGREEKVLPQPAPGHLRQRQASYRPPAARQAQVPAAEERHLRDGLARRPQLLPPLPDHRQRRRGNLRRPAARRGPSG
jgi:hypothetical protein